MRGLSATTGAALDGTAHLRQSIADILTTPLGTRIMRRDYGSLLPELVDAAFNGATRLRLYGAVATALMRWEPRLTLTRVALAVGTEAGAFVLELEGRLHGTRTSNDYTRITIPLPSRSA